MSRLSALLLICLLFASACQPELAALPPATVIAFPTMTPGRSVSGILPTVVLMAADGSGPSLANPATAIALANAPTATPNYGECPPSADVPFPEAPVNPRARADALVRFLSDGGTVDALERGLRGAWNVLGDDGLLRADLDLTGEGAAEIVAALGSGDADRGDGVVLIFGCANGRYVTRYSFDTPDTPRVVQIGDMNYDNAPDILFASRACDDPADETTCAFSAQLITWRGALGRFVSMLDTEVRSETLPQASDVDNDQIAEIVVRLDNPGNAQTGPLRTGVNIYDWNGAAYVRSITQLDPPRFRIQVVHEADRALARLNADEAIGLYEFALSSADLQAWTNDEQPLLNSYILYRLLLAHAYQQEGDLLAVYTRTLDMYPDPATAPVYATLATTFWNALQVTNNLRSACLEVREVIADRPEALALLNRYGSRSPVYAPEDVCPF